MNSFYDVDEISDAKCNEGRVEKRRLDPKSAHDSSVERNVRIAFEHDAEQANRNCENAKNHSTKVILAVRDHVNSAD